MSQPERSLEALTPGDRRLLQAAHEGLRQAVLACEPFRGGPLESVTQAQDPSAMKEAYAAVDRAEAELWRLREQLLGWRRPPGASRAVDVADWFSDEDAAYDNLSTGTA